MTTYLQTLERLIQQQSSIEQEWRELPSKEHHALLKGSKDEVLELMIRRRQIPWQWVDTWQQRAETVLAFLQEQDKTLEARASELRKRLARSVALLEEAYKEVEQLQQEYGAIQGNLEQELPYYDLKRGEFGMQFLHSARRRFLKERMTALSEFIGKCKRLKEAMEMDESNMEYPIRLLQSSIDNRNFDGHFAGELNRYTSIERGVLKEAESL